MWKNRTRLAGKRSWERASSSFLNNEHYNIGCQPWTHSQRSGNMCHLQDVAKKCSIMKSYILFFPSDIRAKVMHLEWISLHYARKIYAEQISLWDIFDARQIALLLSTALSQELMNRSCTLQQPLTQWHQNLSGLF